MELAMLFLDLMHHIHMLVRCSMTECMAVMFWTLPVPVWLSDPLIFHLCVHISLISFSGISGCPWQAWLSSCSCDISSMRCSAVSADIRTTCVSSITWRQGVCVCVYVCAFSLLLIITCLLNSCIYYELCADLLLLLQRSWQPMMMIVPSAGMPCLQHANCPAVISSTSK